MACLFEVTLPAWQKRGIPLAQEALNEIDRIEQQLTVFRDTSEVTFINRNAAERAIRAEASLFELLRLCQKLHRETAGAFDITSGPLIRCWGFFERQGRIPADSELAVAKALVGCEKLLLNDATRTVGFEHPGVEINFGSIGKGYALDRISVRLRTQLQSALLSAGSSSVCALGSGDAGDHGWLVGIRHPRDKTKRIATLRISDCAMATSGSDEQFFEYQGERYGHIIDPRAGRPAKLVSGVTVIAQSAAIADALATAFYVGGAALAKTYCLAHPEILVIMLEGDSQEPVIFGSSSKCRIESLFSHHIGCRQPAE
jgi:thiamine biosynthesis lipoprotein